MRLHPVESCRLLPYFTLPDLPSLQEHIITEIAKEAAR